MKLEPMPTGAPMRIPMQPPSTVDILQDVLSSGQKNPEILQQVFHKHKSAAPKGRYRHWDKLRHLDAPEGLTHHQWWLAIKMARNALSKPLPLTDRDGRPFQVAMPDIAQEMAHRIDQQVAGSIHSAALQPGGQNPHRYLLRSLIEEEAITSSQLEGAATTRRIAKGMLRDKRRPRNNGEQMILNNYEGMRFIAETAKHQELTPELVRELHIILTRETLDDPSAAGRFRRDDEEIVVMDHEKTLHTPPPASQLEERLETLCQFGNDEASLPFIHPVARSILLHFWLAHDHPFIDGNGRTARAIFYWSMLKRGYWLMEYVSISRRLLKARSAYNRAFLYTETDENDTTYFLLHQMRVILQSMDELHDYLNRKVSERRGTLDILKELSATDLPLNHRQLALIRYGIDHPGTTFTIAEHKNYHSIGYATARSDLLGLSNLGLFVQTKSGKTYQFLSPDNLSERIQQAAQDV